jgi:hypothetical protein
MVGGMNDNQTRALWATALQELADAINTGRARAPQSMVIHTQFVTPGELLIVADTTYEKPLAITIGGEFAWITVPVGERLDLDIRWCIEHALPTDPFDRAQATEAFRTHNAECCSPVPFDVVPDPCAGGQCTDPVMHAEGGHDV